MLIKCQVCGKELNRKPSQIKKNKNQFCSLKCVGKYYSGRKRSDETKRKLSLKLKGRNITWGDKISKTKKILGTAKGKNNSMYGKHHSEETKRKISENKERAKKISKSLKGRKGKTGENSGGWKGGKTRNNGYIYIYSPKHPFSSKKYVFEHRLNVENKIGRLLNPKEVVHHINEIKDDNRIENLMLFKNGAEHLKFHIKIRQFGITNPIRRQIENRWKEYNKSKI